jgi:hypothetical protein
MKLVLDSSSQIIHNHLVTKIVCAIIEQLFGDCLLEIFLAKQRPRCSMRTKETGWFIDEDALKLGFRLDQYPQRLSQLLIPSGGANRCE